MRWQPRRNVPRRRRITHSMPWSRPASPSRWWSCWCHWCWRCAFRCRSRGSRWPPGAWPPVNAPSAHAAAVRPSSPSWPMPSMRWQARSAPPRVACAPIRRCWNSMSRIAPARWSAALPAASRNGTRIALLFVDLDNFKSVNDTLGHRFGDRVLQMVGLRLQEALGEHAFIARLGGDEFTVLIEDALSADHVCEQAAIVIEALQKPLLVDGRPL